MPRAKPLSLDKFHNQTKSMYDVLSSPKKPAHYTDSTVLTDAVLLLAMSIPLPLKKASKIRIPCNHPIASLLIKFMEIETYLRVPCIFISTNRSIIEWHLNEYLNISDKTLNGTFVIIDDPMPPEIKQQQEEDEHYQVTFRNSLKHGSECVPWRDDGMLFNHWVNGVLEKSRHEL